MIEVDSLKLLSQEVEDCMRGDREVLDQLCNEIRPLKKLVKRIQPHAGTAISLVGTDGGDNQVLYDPFIIQLVRVVDSSRNEYCLEAITPTYDIDSLSRKHLLPDGSGRTPMGRMMEYLGLRQLSELSPMIPSRTSKTDPPKPSWVQVYRELTEWAVLFSLVRDKDFATDTVIIFDGLLRTKVFAGLLFKRYREGLEEGITRQYTKQKRRIFIAGIAKHSRVLQRFRLPMALEGILRTYYPAYVEVPRALEKKVYQWPEYARGDEEEAAGGEPNRFVAGKMFFVKFGNRSHDPAWAIDLLDSQVSDASITFGYMLGDALNGFPIPFYPLCLQRAHENAALVNFDMEVIRGRIVGALRKNLGLKGSIIDEFEIQESDVTDRRYSDG